MEVETLASNTMIRGGVAFVLQPVLERFLGSDLGPVGLRCWDGSRLGPEDARATIVVNRPSALRRILWAPGEIGLARAYVSGDLDVEGDIFALLELRDRLDPAKALRSLTTPGGMATALLAALKLGAIGLAPPPPPEEARLSGRLHSRSRDAAAISHHYDVGNDFYRLVLGRTMTYSCAYWKDGVESLDDAQIAKYDLICKKLNLQPGMRLLDVGCGWGGLAVHAAANYGATVVGITLSREQEALAKQHAEDQGVSHMVEFRLQDYREVGDGPFDAIASVGMFEHVGIAKARQYFRNLARLLKAGGRLMNHAISRPHPDQNTAIAPKSFVARYVFPDAELIEVGNVVSAMQAMGLEVRDVESLREHYAKTLRAWVANLEAGWEEAIQLVSPARARIWRLYMAGSALGFESNRISIHQVLATKPDPMGKSHMPLTRRWLIPAM